MKKKFYQVSYPIKEAQLFGFKHVEKEAKARLKAMYPKDKWTGAEIVADVKGSNLIYTMEE